MNNVEIAMEDLEKNKKKLYLFNLAYKSFLQIKKKKNYKKEKEYLTKLETQLKM